MNRALVAVIIAIAIAVAAHAYAQGNGLHVVRPLPGYACMLLRDDNPDKNAPLPPIVDEPSSKANVVVLSGSILFAKVPAHIVNGYMEVITINNHPGWFPARDLKPYASRSNPNAHCTPSLMSNGRIGPG